jgi:YggT family protein
VTDPILNPLRSIIPPIRTGGIALDLSPMILMLGLFLLAGAL